VIALASLLAALGSALGNAEHVRALERPPEPLRSALASWYDDGYGPTASGVRYRYGYASLAFGSDWGHRVEFVYGGRSVVGQLDDHGPYVSGRMFDLSARLLYALGCPDLCWLRWREVR
jgi:rare lipoprotein A (peptidoglycan hydrolase)